MLVAVAVNLMICYIILCYTDTAKKHDTDPDTESGRDTPSWINLLEYLAVVYQGDANYLRYHGLQQFEQGMQHLEQNYGFMISEHQYISRKDEVDKVIVFERGNLVFVFNFHWSSSYFDYRIGCSKPGKYKVVLDSDDPLFGGYSRIDHSAEYFTADGWFDERPRSFLVYAPSRTAVVYALVEDEPAPAYDLKKKSILSSSEA